MVYMNKKGGKEKKEWQEVRERVRDAVKRKE